MSYPMIDLQGTSQNIRTLRVSHGLTVRDIQHTLGLAEPQAIYRWEDPGSKTLPSLDNLLILSRLYHAPLEGILIVTGDLIGDDIHADH